MGAVAVSMPSLDHAVEVPRLRRVHLRDESMLPIAEHRLDCDLPKNAPAPAVWLVGAHGGAGCSTLAQLWTPMGDAGQVWPAQEENPFCVIVCRSTKTGLEKAHQGALQASACQAGDIDLLGVVVVDDTPGTLPKVLGRKIEVIGEHFRVWRVPFYTDIRTHECEELASWWPGQPQVEESGRFTKKKSPAVTSQVPSELVRIGEEIFAAAAAAHAKRGGKRTIKKGK